MYNLGIVRVLKVVRNHFMLFRKAKLLMCIVIT